MPKQKPFLNQADISLLKKTFATKKDLNSFVTKDYLNKKLKPINKKLNKIDKTLSTTIRFFDDKVVRNSKRIDRIEDHLELPPLPKLVSV